MLPDRGDGFLTFHLDNDLFAKTDQNYTNGARLTWISGDRNRKDFNDFQRILTSGTGDQNSLGFFKFISGYEDQSKLEYNYGFSLTQLMFTPEDLEAEVAPAGERPYAGWSSLGFSVHAKDEGALNSVELSFGVVGPAAEAEATQDFVHDLRNIDKFNGWDSQVPHEVTVNLFLTQKRKIRLGSETSSGFSIDGFTEYGLALGNFRTNGHLGALVRVGWNLPADFSDPRLSERAYSHQLFRREDESASKWSLYLLGGVRGTAVAHDITLDGSLFDDFDTGVKSESFVGETYWGFGLRFGIHEVSYSHTFRSKEFEEQSGGQQFGSIAYRLSL
ncbi:lipid A deacylase LpxR family protein [Puniceicoccaceae bacterium K14]|nr:lipid A deacylase LpxR family protein [Puniceicoccaceae bacterium K14]